MADRHKLEIRPLGDREIRMTRSFQAPRTLVWDAWTRPELIRRWLSGPEGWSMTECDVDLRVGGAYRFVLTRERDGETMAWGGSYVDLEHPERFINTEKFEPAWYPGESLITNVLLEREALTTLETTMRYESQETRDLVINSGFEEGDIEAYERLSDLLVELLAIQGDSH